MRIGKSHLEGQEVSGWVKDGRDTFFVQKVAPGKSQRDTLKDLTFHFRKNSKPEVQFSCRLAFAELKNTVSMERGRAGWRERRQTGGRGKKIPSERSTKWSNSRKNEMRSRAERRRFDTGGKEKEDECKRRALPTVNIRSEPGGLTERREPEMVFESARKVSVEKNWCRSLLSWNQHAQFSRFVQ